MLSSATVSHDDKRIAIVGMAVQYSGCDNKEEFWDALIGKEVKPKTITASRLGSDKRSEHYVEKRSKYADTFCNEKYGVVNENVKSEHELLLDLAKRAIKDSCKRSGNMEVKGMDRAGIVSGCLSFPMDNLQGEFLNLYQSHIEKKLNGQGLVNSEDWSKRKASLNPNANDKSTFQDPASFVANELGLGPLHYSLDAACASALYVLRLAQDHLVSGAADVMLAGATCFPEPFFILSGFSTFQAMPVGKDGVSLPLHSTSQGLTPGEGGAIYVLKRLGDAVRDGDHIYGVLLGANVSNAGCGLPLKPHLPSEKSCLKDTYTRINKEPTSVQYVEMHATGTPQGDRVEVEAVRYCYEGKVPMFGSTKGNFGHTLVAAGFAGMAKLLMSFEKGIIPPTPGVDETNKIDPNVVTETIKWPDTNGDLKRAALSAFGFGGTNAHAVFEEFDISRYSQNKNVSIPKTISEHYGHQKSKMAIIGMDCTFGSFEGLDAFENALYHSKNASRELPEKRWRFLGKDKSFLDVCGLKKVPRGCYIDSVNVDFKRIKTTMSAEDLLRPTQFLAVQTIDNAILDSGLKSGGNVAVLVGLGTDLELYRHRARVALKENLNEKLKKDSKILSKLLDYVNDCGTSTSYTSYIGNLVATRVSSQWGFTGPSFTITESNNSVYRCTELGKYLLETGEVDAVVIAGVDLCGSAESIYVKSRRMKLSSNNCPKPSFDKDADGYFIGEGCGSFVIKRAVDCGSDQKIYANIDAIVTADTPRACTEAAIKKAKINPANIEMLEVSAESKRFFKNSNALPSELTCESEVDQLRNLFSASPKNHVAIGSVKANIGDVGYASGAATVIKSALAIYNRYLPATPNFNSFSNDLDTPTSYDDSFYVCQKSRPWLKNQDEKRRAAISGISEAKSCYSLLLSEADSDFNHENDIRCTFDDDMPKLIVIEGSEIENILKKLEQQIQATSVLNPKEQLDRLIGITIQEHQKKNTKNIYSLCLIANSKSLARELKLAKSGVERSLKSGLDWKSPSGTYFSPKPLVTDKIAFVYGEGRSPYCGITDSIHRTFPGLHEIINNKTNELWNENDEWINPRTSNSKETEKKKLDFSKNQIEMFRSGVYSSMCFTDLLKHFGVEPKAAFGCSLGEISMLFALSEKNGKLSQEMTNRLRKSPVWSKALAVEFQAIKKLWNISDDAPLESYWQGYVVMSTREEMEKAIGSNKFVRLLIVNDNKSLLIAGKPDECKKVIAKLNLKIPAMPIEQGMVGHCPEVLPYVKDIGYIHEMLEIPNTGGKVDMYTSVANAKLCSENDKLANVNKDHITNITDFVAKLYSKIADFPEIVETVHSEGYKIFVEAGPNNQRSQAIDRILGSKRKHVAVAVDKENEPTYVSLIKTLAALISHQVPGVDLTKLYHPKYVERCIGDVKFGLEPKKVNKFIRKIEINGFFKEDLLSIPSDIVSIENSSSVQVKVLERNMRKPKIFSTFDVVENSNEINDKGKVINIMQLKESLLNLDRRLYLSVDANTGELLTHSSNCGSTVVEIEPCDISSLGDKGFMESYGVDAPLYTGAMAKGIASADLVIAAGKRRILGSFGAGGLPMHLVRAGVDKIMKELPNGPFAVNLIHSPFDSNLEKGNVDLFLEKGVRVIEASAFMTLTPQVVRYRAAGLTRNANNTINIGNKIIGKCSRTELAEMFIRPAPENLLNKLLESGEITQEQAELAKLVPMADDICVEADSGGHTDNRPIHVILPLIIACRNRIAKELKYSKAMRPRVGAGGGIGCPLAAAAAFNMGASFIVTGTINQMCKQSGTCDFVRNALSKATYSDVGMAAAADMFDEGVKLQVLKKGTMFASKANKLYELFKKYDSFESMPKDELQNTEKRIFKQSLNEVWHETKSFYIDQLKNPKKIERAEKDGKLKMSLCCKWYLSKASSWANRGVPDRKLDYQIWCGPAIGSFNDFIKDSYLDPKIADGKYPCVTQVNLQVLYGASYYQRLNTLKKHIAYLGNIDVNDYKLEYKPEKAL